MLLFGKYSRSAHRALRLSFTALGAMPGARGSLGATGMLAFQAHHARDCKRSPLFFCASAKVPPRAPRQRHSRTLPPPPLGPLAAIVVLAVAVFVLPCFVPFVLLSCDFFAPCEDLPLLF